MSQNIFPPLVIVISLGVVSFNIFQIIKSENKPFDRLVYLIWAPLLYIYLAFGRDIAKWSPFISQFHSSWISLFLLLPILLNAIGLIGLIIQPKKWNKFIILFSSLILICTCLFGFKIGYSIGLISGLSLILYHKTKK